MKEQTERLGTIKISDFALRHFDQEFGGTKILNLEPKDFEQYLNTFANQYFDKPEERFIDKADGHVRVDILDGYAPFCKLLVMANITDAITGTMPLTLGTYPYLRSGYSARRESELPVLSRWLDLPLGKPKAKYTVSVLYSKAQMDKEAKSEYEKTLAKGGIDAIGLEAPEPFGADWGVVAILGQMTPREEPMKPMTMMRNYMDISMGGSGMKLPVPPARPNLVVKAELMQKYNEELANYNKALVIYNDEMLEFTKKYEKSVKFWSENATVK
jgi:hypothetical protein